MYQILGPAGELSLSVAHVTRKAILMRAYVVEKPNGEFRAIELPRPVPETNQVLVRITTSGVNPLDTKIRAGKAAHAKQPLPAVLGLDMAGTVERGLFPFEVPNPGNRLIAVCKGELKFPRHSANRLLALSHP